MLPENPVFVALDTADLDQAVAWADAVRPCVGGVKLGLEFFNSNGPDGVRQIVDLGLPVFLDLKFHDIPNTVAGAVRAVAGLGVAIVNVHASGGAAMLAAATAAAAEHSDNRPPRHRCDRVDEPRWGRSCRRWPNGSASIAS